MAPPCRGQNFTQTLGHTGGLSTASVSLTWPQNRSNVTVLKKLRNTSPAVWQRWPDLEDERKKARITNKTPRGQLQKFSRFSPCLQRLRSVWVKQDIWQIAEALHFAPDLCFSNSAAMWREEGGGFRMGNTCIPVADSFWYLANLIQLCKV